ncbi:MAG: hypothetical protein JNM84_11845 [Planctomycetes bacterium]|nr:hypothetical protein [Planctomycetota bacterium]
MHGLLLAALLCAAWPQEPASPPEPPRFLRGARGKLELRSEIELEIETRLESLVSTGKSRITTVFQLELAVRSADAEGGGTLALRLLRLEAEIEDASGRTRWDSERRVAEPADSPRADLLAELARLEGAELELDLDRWYRLRARRGADALAARLGIAPDGAGLAPVLPWLWAAFPRDGQREELELALPIEARVAPESEANPRGPRLRATLERVPSDIAKDEREGDAVVALTIVPRETRATDGARRSMEARGRFAFDAATGLLRRGELEALAIGAREARLDPGRPLFVASIQRAKSRLSWKRLGD